jgi:hypothetical protein
VRPADVLETLKPQEGSSQRSPFGEIVLHYVHGCASFKSGQTQAAASDLAYERAHERDGLLLAADLMLCVGDVEGAAAMLLRQLGDARSHGAALTELADFRPNPPNVPDLPSLDQLVQIKARPDVKAAIGKAGGAPALHFARSLL